MSKSYHLRTFGCQMNEHDSERIAGLLEAEGYVESQSAESADVVVLNTCCIRENADNKLYGTLGNLKSIKERSNPNMQIVVGGCLAQKDKELIQQKAGHVDVVFGTHNVHRAAELIKTARESGPITEIWDEADADDSQAFASALPARRETDYAGWLTIQVGCDNSCAFCIVPAVRGVEISRPPEDILAEAQRLARDGVTEITLLGQNVNSYGRDLSLAARRSGADVKIRPMFADLLRSVGSVEGIRRVRYTSPHPKDMTLDVYEAMAETDSVVPHLHFPLQSGSDTILAAMHRGYTGERFLSKLAQARETIPDVAITTDIIIGFPGETDEDFEQTMAVAAAAEFDNAYTFIFSPRPGTEAAEMTDKFVNQDVAVERYERLRTVIQRSALAKNEARIGRIEEVVVEGPSKKNPAEMSGRTLHNKIVHFVSEPLKPGTYVDVAINQATGQWLKGDLVGISHRATHRTRLPLAN